MGPGRRAFGVDGGAPVQEHAVLTELCGALSIGRFGETSALIYHPSVSGESSIPPPGAVVGGRYRVEAPIGEGGTAVVLAATCLDSGDRVAIKVLREQYAASRELRERHFREARALSSLHSPHVARVFDVGAFPSGATFLVLEYLDGMDLHDVLDRLGPFTPSMAAGLLIQACEGVDQAHRTGIWHRDIKPSNLFVIRADDGLARVKVLDFGLAKLTASGLAALTSRGDVMGSPSYMAPEQICGLEQAAARSDIWSLGVTLYELLTGELPFEGTTPTKIANAVLNGIATPITARRSDLPPDLVALVTSCLEKEPARRPASALDVANALRPHATSALTFVSLCGGGDVLPRATRRRTRGGTEAVAEPTYGGLLPIASPGAVESARIHPDVDDALSAQATLVRVPVAPPAAPSQVAPAMAAPAQAAPPIDVTRGEPTEVRGSIVPPVPRKRVTLLAWAVVIALTLFGTAVLVAAWFVRTSHN